jgi:hypothetical protein
MTLTDTQVKLLAILYKEGGKLDRKGFFKYKKHEAKTKEEESLWVNIDSANIDYHIAPLVNKGWINKRTERYKDRDKRKKREFEKVIWTLQEGKSLEILEAISKRFEYDLSKRVLEALPENITFSSGCSGNFNFLVLNSLFESGVFRKGTNLSPSQAHNKVLTSHYADIILNNELAIERLRKYSAFLERNTNAFKWLIKANIGHNFYDLIIKKMKEVKKQ